MKTYNIFFSVIALMFLISIGACNDASSNKNFAENVLTDSCRSEKLNKLIQTVINTDVIYMIGYYDFDIDYIISNELIPNNKIYESPLKDRVISIPKDSVDFVEEDGGVINFYEYKFNQDTTEAYLDVMYYTYRMTRASSTTILNYEFDSVSCDWKMVDYIKKVH